MSASWIVLHEGHRLRWGGDLRRHHLLLELARRTGAGLVDGWSQAAVGPALRMAARPRWRRRGGRSSLASVELLAPALVREAERVLELALVDVHDDPLAQHAAFGIALPREREVELRALREANLSAFRALSVPTLSFAQLAGLDTARVVVAPNGTDASHVRPSPAPEQPAVGMISGAAPRRGIETLVAAARIVRTTIPDLRLLLWLISTGADSERFLDELRATLHGENWIEIGSAPYEELGRTLGRATVLCVPHPPGDYMDVALPIKLLDSMAAGRPVVVTPRREMAAVVRDHRSGLVAEGDSPEAIADALTQLLADPALAAELGRAGRLAAETTYDWRVIGSRLADVVLAGRS